MKIVMEIFKYLLLEFSDTGIYFGRKGSWGQEILVGILFCRDQEVFESWSRVMMGKGLGQNYFGGCKVRIGKRLKIDVIVIWR